MQRENTQTEVEEDRGQKVVKRLGVSAQPGPLELLSGMLRDADGCWGWRGGRIVLPPKRKRIKRNKTTGLTLTRPSSTNSPNPEEFRSLATSRKRQKARSERECVQTGGIQELNGWSERSWAQSEGEKGGGGGEIHRREGEREGGGVFIYLFFILSSTPARWWWTRVQSSSAAINGPDAAAEHPGREGGLSSRGWIPSSLGGGHAPWTCPNRVLQHTPGLF